MNTLENKFITFLSDPAPKVMGILNATTDSFSDGGAHFANGKFDSSSALRSAESMVAEGASIIDIGAESTRPGAIPVSSDEELARLIPLIEALKKNIDVYVSVDTSSTEVIREAAAVGADLINDVRALQKPGAVKAVADTGLPVCLMHMQGEPREMQVSPHYDDVSEEVYEFLKGRAEVCIDAGIAPEKIIVDPGFGFGKSVEHNISLLQNISHFKELRYPILVGLSRKSMIGKLLNREVEERLPGSLALAILAVQGGARIIRVHDVAATRDVLHILRAIEQNAL